MVRILLLSFLIFVSKLSFAQQEQTDSEGSLVKWITLQEAIEKTKISPRPVMIDFYTGWCGWCKKMMQTTYANPALAHYINNNFYAVKFNAETKDTIEYLGEKYGPVGTGSKTTNALAIKLLQSKLMYPSTLFLNNFDKQKNEFGFSMLAQGYLDIKRVEPMLVFDLENIFHNASFDEFEAEYNKAFYDSAVLEKSKKLNWMKPRDFFGKRDSSSKKTMVLIHTEWCNGCRVMERTSFIDSMAEKYLRKKFDLVDFNPEIADDITFKGKTYTNPRTMQMPFHQLAIALGKNSITLPTLVILDEKLNVLDAIPYYLHPQLLNDVALYYGNDIYKTKSWADFMKQKPPMKF